MIKPKFSGCRSCLYFNSRIRNAACRMCDAGEMFEQRVSSREKSSRELMDLYKETFDHDDK